MADGKFSPALLDAMESALNRNTNTEKHDGCWPWDGPVDRDGYGKLRAGGFLFRAHRCAWMVAYGRRVPDGMVVMHECDQPRCCNPAHLRAGTQAENVMDRVLKGRSAIGRAPNPAVALGRKGRKIRTPLTIRPRSKRSTAEIVNDLLQKKQKKQALR